MVQFSIDWTLTDVEAESVNIGNPISELILNNEWKMICIWGKNSGNILYPLYIEFWRNSTSDTVCISGSLSLQRSKNGRQVPEKKFSEIMQSGSPERRIDLRDTDRFTIFLKGVVNITSVGVLSNAECTHQISIDFGRLLEPETCCPSDVNLKCHDVSIPAHKTILCDRSPVFAAMFNNPMKENLKNEVTIDDMEASDLQIMVVYLYTGKLPPLTLELVSNLLNPANKYQLKYLKKICCDYLKDILSPETALKILFLGQLYCSDMEAWAMDYICSAYYKFSDLEKTDEWINLKKEKPALAMDILTSIVNNIK